MPCFHPLEAYRSSELSDKGKRLITFNRGRAHVEGSKLMLPCGQCIGCRTDRMAQWALRAVHEAKMHDHNCFATFTYSDDHVPQSYSLNKRDMQLFMKRLRAELSKRGQKVRFLLGGEYGEVGLRPHYHACFFGFDPDDKEPLRRNERGDKVYSSEFLSKLWPFGFVETGSLTYESAKYVAGYCLKKRNGEDSDEHYTRVSPMDGKVYRVAPEFLSVSLKPGIGQAFFDKFWSDAFPSDFLIVDGRRVTPPPFYLRQYERKLAREREAAGVTVDPYKLKGRADAAERVKRARRRRLLAPQVKYNSTPQRLGTREESAQIRLKRQKRELA